MRASLKMLIHPLCVVWHWPQHVAVALALRFVALALVIVALVLVLGVVVTALALTLVALLTSLAVGLHSSS